MTTRTDLEEILFANLRGINLSNPQAKWRPIMQCLVEAYNRGISDAAESVRLEKASNYGLFINDTRPEFKPFSQEVAEFTFYGHGGSGYEAIRVEKDSILKLKIGG